MKTVLRSTALTIITCLLATSVVCGEDVIKSKITLTPSSSVFYENYIGIDTPTLSQDFKVHVEEVSYNNEGAADVRIKDAGALKVTAEPETEYNEGVFKSRAFSLKAPDKEGTYKMTFEGKTASGKTFTFDSDIKVVRDDPQQNWMRIGLIAAVVVCATVMILVANSSSGRK